MKRAFVALAAIGVLVAGAAAPAQGASSLQRQVAALQRTVAAQKRQVTSLQKQVTSLKKRVNNTVYPVALEGAVVAYCTAAIAGDAFQTTWQVINQVGSKSVMLPAIQPLDDQSFCDRGLRVLRQPSLVPPTIAPFQQMLARLEGRAAPLPVFGTYWLWGS